MAPKLRRIVEDERVDSKSRLHASLALLPDDETQVAYVYKSLLAADPGDLDVLRRSLWPYRSATTQRLREEVEKGDDKSLLQAAGALALYEPDSPSWPKVCGKLARAMAAANPIHVGIWREVFSPIKDRLRDPLKEIFRDKKLPETDRGHASIYLVDYQADVAKDLVDLLMDAESNEFGRILVAIRRRREEAIPLLEAAIREGQSAADEDAMDRQAERRARAAVALVLLGAGEEVWPLLAHSADPRLRSFVIHWLAPLGVDPGTIGGRLLAMGEAAGTGPAAVESRKGPDPDDPNRSILFDAPTSIRRALILALGHHDPARLDSEDRDRMIRELPRIYRDDPDAGIHGAAEWTLRKWGQDARSREIVSELVRVSEREQTKGPGHRRWYVNGMSQTMVIVGGPLEFRMGSPKTEADRDDNEIPHTRRIPRRFAIAAKEVSVGEFEEFWKAHASEYVDSNIRTDSSPNWPRWGVSWYMAAAYCNWLSRMEGRREVYEPNEGKKFAAGMRVKPGAFDGGGYRLPTEAEWEYACRSGAVTSRYYGNSWRLIRDYARLESWEEVSPVACGSLLPNDLGLFDMMGNLFEWCHDRTYDYGDIPEESTSDFLAEDLIDSPYRVLRGGAYVSRPLAARSACRAKYQPDVSYVSIGFRPARSCP